MKQIHLLRHAKSSWDDPDLRDFERPLAERGKTDAPRMGRFIRMIDHKPDVICSSTAFRAKETTQLFIEGAKMDESVIKWNEDLYFNGPSAYMECIRQTPDRFESLMLVGHNPNMEEIATRLSGGKEKVSFRMPTAALICFETFAHKWSDVGPSTCQVKWMMIPKILNKLMD
ncbi:SixA phosphatase family protein [Balneola sp. MJW-20]|uniref:SixA phosphatase family protein n=1 Tax=Gracilimonas aurantiaca TaxID=3234185 RepID=UPI0034677C3B